MSNIDLETTSMKLAATSSMKVAIVAVLVLATVAVVAVVALSEDDEAVIQAGPNGRAAGTSDTGGIIVVDPCAAIDCAPGRCESENITCECPTGYTDGGDTCAECEPGYTLVGRLCENVDECLSDPPPCGPAEYVDRCIPAAPPGTIPTCTCITDYVFTGGACTACPEHTTGVQCNECLLGYEPGPVGGATCVAKDCGALAVSGATVEGDTYFGAPSPLTVTCNDGYTLSGTPQLRCLESGLWEPAPTCRHNYCSLSLLTLNDAQITGGCHANGRCDVGSTITVTCPTGMVQETETPSCSQSGGALPSWSSSILECGTLDPCIGVVCGDEGTCVGGACVCDVGYDGDTCADCAPGYTRRDASGECVNVDECAGTPHPCTDTVGPLPGTNHACNEVLPPEIGTTPHCSCGAGYDLTNSVCRPTLENAIASRVAKVVAMRDRARSAYESRCTTITSTCGDDSSNDHCTDDACNPSAEWNSNDSCLHSDVFGTNNLCTCDGDGRKMDAAHSTVTINKRVDRDSPVVKEAVCFSKGLDSQFQENVVSDAGIQFQWFASEAGPLRTFPGDARQLPSYAGDRPDNRGLDLAYSMADESTAPWLTVNAVSGERITDEMTCADCVAQGFQCGQCIKYGFDCTNTCSGDQANQQRLVQDAKYCNWHDPREESWYVSAVSGPKDIVIVVDLSASMSQCAGSGSAVECETRLEVAKVAVRKVLETLSERDYAQIIPFGNFASCFNPGCTADCGLYNVDGLCATADNKMLQMTSGNRALLEQYLTEMTITAGAGNSFRKGFSKAFDVLDNSVADATAGCTKAVLFFTDGAGPREGSSNPDEAEVVIQQYDATWGEVKSRNQDSVPTGATGPHQAHVFWYSVTRPPTEFTSDDQDNLFCQNDICTPWHDLMGNTFLASLNGARYNPPYAKKITCQNHGIYSHIRDPSMVEDALASYYQFLSRAAPSDTVRWSQIYTDESTGKEVVAGTLAVYTSGDDPVLVGVVGMTVLVSSFDYGETARRNALLETLADNDHSGNCVPRSRDLRTLERLRYTYGTRIDITGRNNAHDQAYAAERDADSFANSMAVEDAGYFSTCCMDDDRKGYPPGTQPAAGSRYPMCTNPAACTETGDLRPKNDWYDHDMCSADDYAGVPTVADAVIETERYVTALLAKLADDSLCNAHRLTQSCSLSFGCVTQLSGLCGGRGHHRDPGHLLWHSGAVPGVLLLLWWARCGSGQLLCGNLRRHRRCGGYFCGCHWCYARALTGTKCCGWMEKQRARAQDRERERERERERDGRRRCVFASKRNVCLSTQAFIPGRS
eukprot:COSAG02_NODE_2560_length_8525_cov_89.485348_4_plen_1305_part_00